MLSVGCVAWLIDGAALSHHLCLMAFLSLSDSHVIHVSFMLGSETTDQVRWPGHQSLNALSFSNWPGWHLMILWGCCAGIHSSLVVHVGHKSRIHILREAWKHLIRWGRYFWSSCVNCGRFHAVAWDDRLVDSLVIDERADALRCCGRDIKSQFSLLSLLSVQGAVVAWVHWPTTECRQHRLWASCMLPCAASAWAIADKWALLWACFNTWHETVVALCDESISDMLALTKLTRPIVSHIDVILWTFKNLFAFNRRVTTFMVACWASFVFTSCSSNFLVGLRAELLHYFAR